MKRHIAAAALVLAALGAASQVQAEGWETGRSHGNSGRHEERSDHRGWQGDRRGGDSWRRSWHEPARYQWRDEGRYWRPRYGRDDYYYRSDYGHDYDNGDISLLISLPLHY